MALEKKALGHWDVASFWWKQGPTLAKVWLASFIAGIRSPLKVKTTRSWRLETADLFWKNKQKRCKIGYNLNSCWLQALPGLFQQNCFSSLLSRRQTALWSLRRSPIHPQRSPTQLEKANRRCLAMGTRLSIMGLNSTSLGALGNEMPVESGEANQSVSLQDWTITRRHFQHRFQAIQSCHGSCAAHRFRRPSPCLHPQPAPWDSKKRISITFSCKDNNWK